MDQIYISGGIQDHKKYIRDIFLINTSLILAFFFEVLPFEADILYNFYGNYSHFLVLKAFFLMLILLPLILFIKRNGLSTLKCVRVRVCIIAFIIFINLILQCIYLIQSARVAHNAESKQAVVFALTCFNMECCVDIVPRGINGILIVHEKAVPAMIREN
jgi:hypothetical protein